MSKVTLYEFIAEFDRLRAQAQVAANCARSYEAINRLSEKEISDLFGVINDHLNAMKRCTSMLIAIDCGLTVIDRYKEDGEPFNMFSSNLQTLENYSESGNEE
ncbi:hypothetical protein [Vibrio algivorus]|uniref:Uncharacterized protein n=1 Tax=Vibrio algivorus TaxID=1667024 RepID=A0A557P6A7_9VIBR|nr:hypothetical protein [Vibrio algivorus]TVO36202.1 hypothetical protein FOF44_09835 [Vibrio algivorus]